VSGLSEIPEGRTLSGGGARGTARREKAHLRIFGRKKTQQPSKKGVSKMERTNLQVQKKKKNSSRVLGHRAGGRGEKIPQAVRLEFGTGKWRYRSTPRSQFYIF